jgi:nucleoside-diphosphate-sugar epimerase
MQREVDCLVTGATGLLGRAVVTTLLRSGVSVRSLVRESSSHQLDSVASDGPFPQAAISQVVSGNLLSPTQLTRAVDGIRVVYHLGAETRGLPATIFAGTVVGSKHLLQAILRARPQRVVLISSLNVYGLANAEPTRIVTEDSALEEHPEKRDVYTHSKIWQERLFREYLAASGIELTIVRPGYIYGLHSSQLPGRLGLSLGHILLQVNSGKPLPITYLWNCADAVTFCGTKLEAANEGYNVIDDGVPTGAEYLERYNKLTHSLRAVRSPFSAFSALSYLNQRVNKWTAGQIPVVVTRYKAACAWRGHQFSNYKLKRLGWRQPISTEAALALAFPDPTPSDQPQHLPFRSAA